MAGYWSVMGDAVARWTLQETTGSVAADSAGSSSAPLIGGLTFASGSRPGPRPWSKSGLGFNGVDQYVSIPSPETLQLGSNHSFALWCRLTGSSASDQVILEMGGTVRTTTLSVSTGSLHLLVRRNNQDAVGSFPYPLDGSWNHVVGVSEAGQLRLYLNGVECASEPIVEPWDGPPSHQGAIGACDAGVWFGGSTSDQDAHLEGEVADVAVFGRSLSASEVAELFAGPEPTLLATPAFARPPRVAEASGFIGAVWDSQNNGPVASVLQLEASPDGLSGWQAVAAVPSGFVPPTAFAGSWLRLTEVATNDGGASELAVGDAVPVTDSRWPGSAVIGSSHAAAVVAEQTFQPAVAAAGQIIPSLEGAAS